MTEPTLETRMDPMQHAWNVHTANQEWIKQAESKASFLLTIDSALLVYFGGRFPDYTTGRLTSTEKLGATVVAVVALGLIAIGICQLVLVVYPRLRTKEISAESSANAIYFGHLANQDARSIEHTLRRRAALPQIARQLAVTSRIAMKKHERLQSSIQWSCAGVALTTTVILMKIIAETT